MHEIICYTSNLPEGAQQNISFLELLLDDNWANGEVQCPETLYAEIGSKNARLKAKQNYEFLLRAAWKYPVKAIGVPTEKQSIASANIWEEFRTDCYITGKYQQKLLDTGYFNPVVANLLTRASNLPDQEEAVSLLEKMISHAPEYYEIDDNTRPILIYRGTDICNNVLNLFAEELAHAFLQCRQRVEIFDVEKEGNQALTRYIGQHYKAVIGIQTYVFSIKMKDNVTNLHDLVIAPKYNMILDHPAWMGEHIHNAPKNYYLLIHDRNYMAFANQYYQNIKGCIYFPPAGTLPAAGTAPVDKAVYSAPLPAVKPYDITFIGTYRDYRERLSVIGTYDRIFRFLAARYINIMRKHPDYPAEKALETALEYYHIKLNDADFLDLFYEMRQACFCIMLYYREKVLQTLLDAGLKIHVYSDSWLKAPFAQNKGLICHPELSADESLKIMQQSKISLNIMSWHKDGLTERILNAMLCQSVVLSDRSTALEEEFANGEDLVLFSLSQLDSLPALVKELLADDKKMTQIAMNGYVKARKKHQWSNRAEQLLRIWDEE